MSEIQNDCILEQEIISNRRLLDGMHVNGIISQDISDFISGVWDSDLAYQVRGTFSQ